MNKHMSLFVPFFILTQKIGLKISKLVPALSHSFSDVTTSLGLA
jgi:hypothetical protein